MHEYAQIIFDYNTDLLIFKWEFTHFEVLPWYRTVQN